MCGDAGLVCLRYVRPICLQPTPAKPAMRSDKNCTGDAFADGYSRCAQFAECDTTKPFVWLVPPLLVAFLTNVCVEK